MKEKLYTLPLTDAFRADDECPFCYIERQLEQHAIDFTLGPGASYMEDDVRAETDKAGFCKEHYRQMFVYGNRIGSALIMETHLRSLSSELKKETRNFSSKAKSGIMGRFRKSSETAESGSNVSKWVHMRTRSCYICDQIRNNYDRYLATFYHLFKKNDPEFMELLKKGKGFCLPHFGDLIDGAENALNDKEQSLLREILFPQMTENLDRIIDEVDWFQKKFDYQFKDADWKNSRDAVQRAMQKAGSGYPADAPYEQK